MLERLFEDLGLQRLLTEQPMQLSNLALQGPVIRRRNDLLAAAGRGQGALSDETTPGEELLGATPCRRAIRLTVAPGSKVSSTMRTFSEAAQRRRR